MKGKKKTKRAQRRNSYSLVVDGRERTASTFERLIDRVIEKYAQALEADEDVVIVCSVERVRNFTIAI